MTAELVVDLYGTRLGTLRGDWRNFDFVADEAAVQHFGLESPVLSLAVPLSLVRLGNKRDRRQNYFRELLPEGQVLKHLVELSGIPDFDVMGLLGAFGRDVAGAVDIWDPETLGTQSQANSELVTDLEIGQMLLDLRRTPLGNRLGLGKISLAGVQDKIVLARIADRWHHVGNGRPSTHILKPESKDFPSMIYDEEYGSRCARALGLLSYSCEIERFDAIPALVIERYDRNAQSNLPKIHQEDFNQILGASGMQKYQRFGGKVSLQQVAAVLARCGAAGDLERLFRLLVLSLAVGNLDLHAKNISVLHHLDGVIALAPAYDIVPQTHFSNDGQMAMAIHGEYHHAAVSREHVVQEAQRWGLKNAASLFSEIVESLIDFVERNEPLEGSYPLLSQDILGFSHNLIRGKQLGKPRSRH